MKHIDFTKVSPEGEIVAIVSTDTGDIPIEATSINQDLAVLYPNGQFRRVILDSEGFANEKKAKAQ